MNATRSGLNGTDQPNLMPLAGDRSLVDQLRRGDETAFVTLVERYHAAMIRLAMIYVDDRAIAEDVVQDAWMGILQGIHRFEGRSSLKTWIFHILLNLARTRGQREGRTIPFSALAHPAVVSDEPAVEPERFLPASHPRWPHHWTSFPARWDDVEGQLLLRETRAHIDVVVARLPPQQRQVITLRDIEGWSADEVCNILGITETNQRVLLHRARSKVRRELDQYFRAEQGKHDDR